MARGVATGNRAAARTLRVPHRGCVGLARGEPVRVDLVVRRDGGIRCGQRALLRVARADGTAARPDPPPGRNGNAANGVRARRGIDDPLLSAYPECTRLRTLWSTRC